MQVPKSRLQSSDLSHMILPVSRMRLACHFGLYTFVASRDQGMSERALVSSVAFLPILALQSLLRRMCLLLRGWARRLESIGSAAAEMISSDRNLPYTGQRSRRSLFAHHAVVAGLSSRLASHWEYKDPV